LKRPHKFTRAKGITWPGTTTRLSTQEGASQKEIKAAYRRLARKHHPDVNPGDRTAEGRFKEINQAFEGALRR